VNDGVMDHPFHFHVNPFQVISRNGTPEPFGPGKIVVLSPSGGACGSALASTIPTGLTVSHCHILDHEEAGDDGTLDVLPLSFTSITRALFMPQ